MAKATIFLIFGFIPSVSYGHIGHVGELAGHDHVIAGVAIGIAIALGLREALKGKKDPPEETIEDEEEATA